MRILYLICIFLLLSFSAVANNKEKAICGSIKEPFLFWLWSNATPEPDDTLVAGIKFIVPTEFQTSDNKVLRGYKYLSNSGDGNPVQPKGYVLMALGNAMLSDQIVGHLQIFTEKNLDVYVFDYRGYGKSDGKRRLNAIIEDYQEIASSLNEKYEKKLLYGISLGGAIIMNVIGSGVEYDSAVVDSSPSLLSSYGCPERVDPITNLPEDSSKLLIITGKKDRVLGENMTALLRDTAQQKGAKIHDGEEFSHPFMDSRLTHNKRMVLVIEHLAGK